MLDLRFNRKPHRQCDLRYVFGAYFWLDVIALISLLPDTWLFKAVFESNQALTRPQT